MHHCQSVVSSTEGDHKPLATTTTTRIGTDKTDFHLKFCLSGVIIVRLYSALCALCVCLCVYTSVLGMMQKAQSGYCCFGARQTYRFSVKSEMARRIWITHNEPPPSFVCSGTGVGSRCLSADAFWEGNYV